MSDIALGLHPIADDDDNDEFEKTFKLYQISHYCTIVIFRYKMSQKIELKKFH